MRLGWIARMGRDAVVVGLVGLALWLAGASGARAFAVVSNGVTYEVEISGLATGVSFNAANAGGALKETPWFGDFALARDVAAALPTDILSGGMEVFLPYRLSLAGLTVNSVVGSAHGLGLDLFRNRNENYFDIFDGTLAPHQAWALGTAREMPEIDGPALAQALFILGAMLLGLRARRGRAGSGPAVSAGAGPGRGFGAKSGVGSGPRSGAGSGGLADVRFAYRAGPGTWRAWAARLRSPHVLQGHVLQGHVLQGHVLQGQVLQDHVLPDRAPLTQAALIRAPLACASPGRATVV